MAQQRVLDSFTYPRRIIFCLYTYISGNININFYLARLNLGAEWRIPYCDNILSTNSHVNLVDNQTHMIRNLILGAPPAPANSGPDPLHMSNVYMRRSRLARLPPIRQYTYALHGLVSRFSRRTRRTRTTRTTTTTTFEKKRCNFTGTCDLAKEIFNARGWAATRAESRPCPTQLSTMCIGAVSASTSRNMTATPSPITSNERCIRRKSKISLLVVLFRYFTAIYCPVYIGLSLYFVNCVADILHLECPVRRRKLLTTAQYIYKTLFQEEKGSDITVFILGRAWRLHKVYISQV